MSVIRCAKTAAAVGKLGQNEKKAMESLWRREHQGAMASGLSDSAAGAHADDQVKIALSGMAHQARRVAKLQVAAQTRISADAFKFRNRKGMPDVGEYTQQLVNRVFFQSDALFQSSLTELGAMIHEFRRKPITGLRHNQTRMELVGKEIFGEATGDAEAKIFADAWNTVAERMRQLFNSAGGSIAKLDTWRMPQHHNATAVGAVELDKWKAFIRPLLDPARMMNPYTGKTITGPELEEALDHAYRGIVEHGTTEETALAGQQGVAMWRRRMDPRFFAFKDFASWQTYQKKFGAGGDEFETMMGWMRSITHDIAAMQTLGPSPDATMRWLTGPDGMEAGVIMSELDKALAGKRGALFPSQSDFGGAFKNNNQRTEYARKKAHAAQQSWKWFAGHARRPVHKGWATTLGTANNLIYASALKYTAMLTGSDLANQALTRWFNGVPMRTMFLDAAFAMKNSMNRQLLTDFAIAVDVGHNTMISEARESTLLQAQAWSRGIADRTMTLSLLKPITFGMRAMWTVGNLRALAKLSSKSYADLPARFQASLKRYGIEQAEWQVIQATPVRQEAFGSYMLPKDIAQTPLMLGITPRPGLNVGQEVALRVLTMIREEGEPAVISGTPRSARFLQTSRPGTTAGFVNDSLAKLKTYSISHVQNHGYRMMELYWRNGRGLIGASAAGAYMGSLLTASFMLNGFGQMARDVASGKHPQEMDNEDYWRSLMLRSISFGFLDDAMKALLDPNSFDPTFFGGPALDRVGDLIGLGNEGVQAARDAITGERKSKIGRQSLKALKSWTPGTWYTDLAMQRFVFDNLQKVVDPEAEQSFANAASRADKAESPYWWAPGDTTPESAPWDAP